nr:toxin-antitoxin system HicB family antitoxin [Blautia wexlerae]
MEQEAPTSKSVRFKWREYVTLRIPRSLHRLLAEHSQREGISMNQYCVYLLSRNDAVFSK